MNSESVRIVQYDPQWPEKFEQEKKFLLSILGDWLHGSVEHVGSTAVPGLVAKPVIDMMFGVSSLDESRPAIDILSDNGYCYFPYKADVKHWFCKPSPSIRTHHLHLVPYMSPLWHERIVFRDILRNRPDIAADYGALKQELAITYADDREAYTQKKWPFVQKVLNEAE